MGTYAHEFGHNLGFPDEYASSYTIQRYDLMDVGNTNGPLRKGECPASLSPYERTVLKLWARTDTLTRDTTNFKVVYNYANPKMYTIIPFNRVPGSNERYIFETRLRQGFDLYVPNEPDSFARQPGVLLVWHLSFWSETYDVGDSIELVRADNNVLPFSTDFFPKDSVTNRQSFNDLTTPKPRIGNKTFGTPAHFALNGIRRHKPQNPNDSDYTIIDTIALKQAYISVTVDSNWNMVATPVVLNDSLKSQVYPTATSHSFFYDDDGRYRIKDTIHLGTGYWVKFGSNQLVTYTGTPVESFAIPVVTGWNMIGSLWRSIATTAITTSPAGIVTSKYFTYNTVLSQYDSVLTMEPGKSYWVKASQNGVLILDLNSTSYTPPSLSLEMPPPGPPSTPAAPTLASPTNGQTGCATTIALKWHPSFSATGYYVEVSADQSFEIIFDAEEVTDTTWTVGPLSNGTTYYWHVTAFNDLGWSNPSSDWHFTTQPAPSISLSWTASTSATPPACGSSCNPKVSNCRPRLTWTAQDGATGPYDIFRYSCPYYEGDCGGPGTLVVDNHTQTCWVDNTVWILRPGQTPQTTFYYYVRGGSGSGPQSNKVAVNTNMVWKLSDEEGAIVEEKPTETRLLGNYPNPFNPQTTIRYDVAEPAHVLLTVYDVLGRVVAVLVNEDQTAGQKSVELLATNLPSGVYFYRLTAGSFTDVKKILLVK